MKKIILTGLACALIGFSYSQKSETAEFTVYGNCGMCERTIEGAVGDKDGVSKADWSQETQMMSVSYHPEIISLDEIKEKIAAKGYDSDTHKAKDKIYNALPGCCKYYRPGADSIEN